MFIVMFSVFIKINFFTDSSKGNFPTPPSSIEAFADYFYKGESQITNSFADPRFSNPVALLNNPTTTLNGDEAYNEEKYNIGSKTNEFITPQFVENGIIVPPYLSNIELNTICKSITTDDCVASSYCALVGDGLSRPKCVPGNARGPYLSYSDINVDYYYYQNRCYGNCPGYYNTLKGRTVAYSFSVNTDYDNLPSGYDFYNNTIYQNPTPTQTPTQQAGNINYTTTPSQTPTLSSTSSA
jgi:hypothetical protein